MPNENAVVDLVTGIQPPLEDQSADELLRANPGGVEISFAESPEARLVPGDMAAGTLEILDQFRQLAHPVYVELEPDARTVVRLRIPIVTTVGEIRDEGNTLSLLLDASHSVHLLERSSPDFEEWRATLEEARTSRATVVVTETDDHEILDVRAWTQRPFPAPAPPVGTLNRPWWFRLWRWCCGRLRCYLRCVSLTRAQYLFDQMNAQTCNPLTVPAPCIPFLFPDDGCWARAHEMCRLLLLHGARPRKIWINAGLGWWLHTPTRNHPNCSVRWGWHVAPTLCVRRWWRWWPFHITDMVIDPSLFSTPVTIATWKAAQGDPSATLTPSDASLYWRNYMPADPGYLDTNLRLAIYRGALKNRSLQSAGPPPYASCP